MKVATWNINGVRARLETALNWLKEAGPDILCLQEIKCEDARLPRRDLRGTRLQRLDPRPEGLQRRRHPLEAAARGRAFGSGRRRQRRPRPAVHRGGRLGARCGRCVSSRSTCPTAIRSAATSSTTSSPGWSGWRLMPAPAWPPRKASVLAGDFNVIPDPIDARFPDNWRRDALFQAGNACCLAAPRQSRPHRRLSRLQRRTRRLYASGIIRQAPGRRTTASASTTCCCRPWRPIGSPRRGLKSTRAAGTSRRITSRWRSSWISARAEGVRSHSCDRERDLRDRPMAII